MSAGLISHKKPLLPASSQLNSSQLNFFSTNVWDYYHSYAFAFTPFTSITGRQTKFNDIINKIQPSCQQQDEINLAHNIIVSSRSQTVNDDIKNCEDQDS